MSAEDATKPEVENQEEDDDVPELEEVADNAAAMAPAMMAERAGKQTKKYAKAMQKLGLKPEDGIMRVSIRKTKGVSFGISKPEVYKFPGTNTFVIFGEAQVEDHSNDLSQKMASMAAGAPPSAEEAPAAQAPAAEEPAADENDDEDPGEIQQKEIDLVMTQAGVSRGKAIRALKNNEGDIVNSIMELTC